MHCEAIQNVRTGIHYYTVYRITATAQTVALYRVMTTC